MNNDHTDTRPRISRRVALRALAAAAAALPLAAACGQAPSKQTAPAGAPTTPPSPAAAATSQQQAPAKPAGAVTVKYLTWWWAEKGRNDAWRDLVQRFHASQNDVRIEEIGFPYTEYFQRVTTQLAGGKLDADVLSFTDELAVRLMKGNFLEPVDGVATRLGIQDKLDKPTHDFVRVNSKLYGLLGLNIPYAVIYNSELYSKAGVSKAPTSIEEYLAAAKQLTRRPDQFGHAGRNTMPEQTGWWFDLSHWVLAADGMWVKDKKPQLTQPAVINAVKAYKQLYDEAMPQGADASTYRRMAWEGKVAQYIDNSANINILKSGNPDIYPHIRSAAPPWPNKRSVSSPNYIGIYSGSANKQAAATWLEFVFRPENFSRFMQAALDIYPPYDGLLPESYTRGLPWIDGFQAAQGTPIPAMVQGLEANIAELRQTVLTRVSEVLTAGKAPEQAMTEAQSEVEDLVTRAG